MTTTAMPTARELTAADLFFLRGLLWCGPCNELLIPAFSPISGRCYGCPSTKCLRPHVNADQAETAAWSRYADLNETAARAVRNGQRHQALIEVLKRVTVGRSDVDLGYEWRDR